MNKELLNMYIIKVTNPPIMRPVRVRLSKLNTFTLWLSMSNTDWNWRQSLPVEDGDE